MSDKPTKNSATKPAPANALTKALSWPGPLGYLGTAFGLAAIWLFISYFALSKCADIIETSTPKLAAAAAEKARSYGFSDSFLRPAMLPTEVSLSAGKPSTPESRPLGKFGVIISSNGSARVMFGAQQLASGMVGFTWPRYLGLDRRSNTFTALTSSDGKNWRKLLERTIRSFGDTLTLDVTGYTNSSTSTEAKVEIVSFLTQGDAPENNSKTITATGRWPNSTQQNFKLNPKGEFSIRVKVHAPEREYNLPDTLTPAHTKAFTMGARANARSSVMFAFLASFIATFLWLLRIKEPSIKEMASEGQEVK